MPRVARRRPTENRMLFVALGLVLIALNLAGIGPVGAWNWEFFGDLWKFCVPFVLAIVWWVYSDKSGLNKRREMERMEDKKKARRAKDRPRKAAAKKKPAAKKSSAKAKGKKKPAPKKKAKKKGRR